MVPSRPFERSYWAIPGQLLGGCFPGDLDPEKMDAKLTGLVQAGVTLVVNLMEPNETNRAGQPFVDYGPPLDRLAAGEKQKIRRCRFPIRDMSIPSPGEMRTILDAIRQEMARGGVVYVHCWGGRGRTGTGIGCCLLEAGGDSAAGVLERLRALTSHAPAYFQPTPQTQEQCDFVLKWRPAR